MDAKSGINIEEFLSPNKSMIIAPAGYGKTHTIVDCLEQFQFEDKRILILTHTHAGIASIKDKITERSIPTKKYEITTICSFALNLTLSFVPESNLPDDSDMKEKFRIAQSLALRLLMAKPIQSVLRAKYEHVIVDEYQDCDTVQHALINSLGNVAKVHILGDPMQSIFGFNGTSVDLNSNAVNAYREHLQELSIPWRWNNAGCASLGEEIFQIRQLLESHKEINLTQFRNIQFVKANTNDLYWHGERNGTPPQIIVTLRHYLSHQHTGNVLILHPDTYQKETRVKLTKKLSNLGMLESIDDDEFYKTIAKFESTYGYELIASTVCFLKETCVASHLDKWIHHDGTLVNKSSNREKDVIEKYETLKEIIKPLLENKNASVILSVIRKIRKLFNIRRVIRQDIYYSIERILKDAESRNISFSQALKMNRDKVRRIGRNISGKYIGTTLLTKGLECETVIILNADKFPDEKHLYVAISRCSKRLIIASDKAILSPYRKQEKKTVQPDLIQPSLFPELDNY